MRALLHRQPQAAMQAMLDELSRAVHPRYAGGGRHGSPGWHNAGELDLQEHLTPILLPPYSPELNAIERVWLGSRKRFLSHRLWRTYDDVLDGCYRAWNALADEASRIRSLFWLDWATPIRS